jgi:uncharacterized coiled-coil protein SlyX
MAENGPFSYDVRNLQRKAFKGIDPKLVQSILDEAKAEVSKLQGRITDLEARVATYEGERTNVNNALIAAQKSADETVRQSNELSERILDDAKKAVAQVEAQHHEALKVLQGELEELMVTKQRFGEDFRALLKGYQAELEARFPGGSTARRTEMAVTEPVEIEPAAPQSFPVFEPPSEAVQS